MRMVRSLFLLTVLLVGCGQKDKPVAPVEKSVSETGTVLLNLTYDMPRLAKPTKAMAVDKMTAYVYESDGTTEIARADLQREGNRGKAQLTVKAGDNRSVVVVAYEGSLVKWEGIDSDVDVVAGQSSTADVKMVYLVVTLGAPGQVEEDTDADGDYSLSWSSVPGATEYTLEEDENGIFPNPVVVYTGSELSVDITGKEDGTYYYRVKASNASGDSPWSSVEPIQVDLTGAIDIDVPWPPEVENGKALLPVDTTVVVNAFQNVSMPGTALDTGIELYPGDQLKIIATGSWTEYSDYWGPDGREREGWSPLRHCSLVLDVQVFWT